MSQQASPAPNIRDNVKHIKAIADGVIHVSKAMKELQSGDLKESTIVVLLSHHTKMSQKAIKKVLDGLSELEETYVKPREERVK